MYLSCSTLCFNHSEYPDLDDVLLRIKAMGFAAADLAAFENWQNVNPSSLLTDDGRTWAKRFAGSLATTGLRVSSFNCGLSTRLNDPDPGAFAQYMREYRALLDFAGDVGCPNLTVQPGYPIEGLRLADSQAITQQHLEVLARMNEGCGVTLSVEGHQGSILENLRSKPLGDARYPAAGDRSAARRDISRPRAQRCAGQDAGDNESGYRGLRLARRRVEGPWLPGRGLYRILPRLRRGLQQHARAARLDRSQHLKLSAAKEYIFEQPQPFASRHASTLVVLERVGVRSCIATWQCKT